MRNYALRGALTGASLFVLASVALAQQSVTIPNGTASIDAAGEPDNVIVTRTATVAMPMLGGASIVSGDLSEVNPATFASEARVRVRSSRHPGHFMDIQFTNSGDIVGVTTLTPGPVVAATGTLAGKDIQIGDTLTFEFFESFQDDQNLPEATWNNLVFNLVPPPPPPASIDLGTIGAPGISTTTFLDAQEVQWFKFTINDPVDLTRFLDIHTRNTTTFLGGAFDDNDTEIGLYSPAGNLLFTNDDEDFVNDILTSLLQFGFTSPFNDELTAGTYYLAVGGFDVTFNGSWDVTSNSTAVGNVVVTLETDLAAGSSTINGTVLLEDWTASVVGRSMSWQLLDSNGTPVESGTTTLGAGGVYSITPTTSTGLYTLTMKASHWLKGGVENIALGGTATANFSLINGDVDGDNEVGPGDFGQLATAFLSVDGDPNWNANADLDGDGEVGPGDFGILANNFLEAGYGA